MKAGKRVSCAGKEVVVFVVELPSASGRYDLLATNLQGRRLDAQNGMDSHEAQWQT